MRVALIALAAGSLVATAASAQTNAPSASPPAPSGAPQASSTPQAAPASDTSTAVTGVVVEGRTKDALNAFAAAVDKFVRDDGRPGPVHQLTRWTRPICPEAFGLQKDFDAYISQRIRALAQKVGAAGLGKCHGTNVLVVFTVHPDAVMADVRDHHALLLGPHLAGEAAKVAAFQPPMKSWYVTLTTASLLATKNKDGREMRILDSPYGQEQPNCTEIRECTLDKMRTMKSEFAFALVVVQSDRVVGKPIGAIADEIAMTILSKPAEREGCSALPSVMDLLNPACPASNSIKKGLTPYDEAYLKALYAPHDTEILAYDRARIKRAVQAVGLSPETDPQPTPVAGGETKPGDAPSAVGPGQPADGSDGPVRPG